MNTASDWLFNLMLWGAIVTLLGLCFHVLVAPILSPLVALVALAFIVVVSAKWPSW